MALQTYCFSSAGEIEQSTVFDDMLLWSNNTVLAVKRETTMKTATLVTMTHLHLLPYWRCCCCLDDSLIDEVCGNNRSWCTTVTMAKQFGNDGIICNMAVVLLACMTTIAPAVSLQMGCCLVDHAGGYARAGHRRPFVFIIRLICASMKPGELK